MSSDFETRNYIIYKLTCTMSGKSYIGQTCKGLNYRFSQHVSDFFQKYDKKKTHRPLDNAFNKYGTECWSKEIIAECVGLTAANELEKELIIKYDTYKNGYNGTHGGDGVKGVVWTDEMRAAASAKLKHVFSLKPIEEMRTAEHTKELQSQRKLENHWRAEGCIVNGLEYGSLRQAAVAFETTIYKVKISIKTGLPLEKGVVNWARIVRNELEAKEEKYLKSKGLC